MAQSRVGETPNTLSQRFIYFALEYTIEYNLKSTCAYLKCLKLTLLP